MRVALLSESAPVLVALSLMTELETVGLEATGRDAESVVADELVLGTAIDKPLADADDSESESPILSLLEAT